MEAPEFLTLLVVQPATANRAMTSRFNTAVFSATLRNVVPHPHQFHRTFLISPLVALLIPLLAPGFVVELTGQLTTGGGDIVAAGGAHGNSVPRLGKDIPEPVQGIVGNPPIAGVG